MQATVQIQAMRVLDKSKKAVFRPALTGGKL